MHFLLLAVFALLAAWAVEFVVAAAVLTIVMCKGRRGRPADAADQS